MCFFVLFFDCFFLVLRKYLIPPQYNGIKIKYAINIPTTNPKPANIVMGLSRKNSKSASPIKLSNDISDEPKDTENPAPSPTKSMRSPIKTACQ